MTTPDATTSQLYEWLCGEFGNQAQAWEQPTWFVHLRLWHCPIPQGIHSRRAIFAEQANALYLDKPYRQRIMVIQPDPLEIHYWALKEPGQWVGAGANPQRLMELTEADLEPLSGCVLNVEFQAQTFTAVLPATARCCFQYQGEERQVILGFQATPEKLLSYDRGIDPVTGASLWGAIMGPYEFQRV